MPTLYLKKRRPKPVAESLSSIYSSRYADAVRENPIPIQQKRLCPTALDELARVAFRARRNKVASA